MSEAGTNFRLIGQRLVEARKSRGITQERAADHLGMSRPTFIAIEKGDRAATPDELVRLAEFYGVRLHELVRPGVPVSSLEPHLRAAVRGLGNESSLDIAISKLQRLAEDYRELENLLGITYRESFPPEIALPSMRIDDFAEDSAMRERTRLGLGDQPIPDLRETLEVDVGLRIFYSKLPSDIAGLYAYASDLGYCVLVNLNHPAERRRQTLSHEYGHFLTERHKPGVDYFSTDSRKPTSERFAEKFGLCFLMPANAVRRQFLAVVSSRGDFQVADLCRMSSFFFVSVQAMTFRLEELGLIRRGSWDSLREEGFSVRTAQRDLGTRPDGIDRDDEFPQRYKFLAVQAYEQGLISEGQLSRFLRCDRVRARELVAECQQRAYFDTENSANTNIDVALDYSLTRASE